MKCFSAKNLIVSIFIALLTGTVVSNVKAEDIDKAELIMDGFLLTGVDGKIINIAGKWLFEFNLDVSSAGQTVIKAGSSITLLPSSALEKAVSWVDTSKETHQLKCRLWGRITKYKDKNFIFPIYFLPLSKVSKETASSKKPLLPSQTQQSPAQRKPAQQKTNLAKPSEVAPVINEPEDILTIPQEVIEKLKRKRIIQPAPPPLITQINTKQPKQDFILVDRTGFIKEYKKVSKQQTANSEQKLNTTALFVLDSLGEDLGKISFGLLPCEALEQAQQLQLEAGQPVRFKIAAVVTQYKGKCYLLLQRAIPAYNYGNFAQR